MFEHGGGRDVVVDFGFGGEADRLDLTDFLRGGEAPTLAEVGADVWIAFGEDEIVLLDTRIADLTATPTGYVFG